MIYMFFAALSSICAVSQSVATKQASFKENCSSPILFNVFKTGAAFVFFLLISLYGLHLHLQTLAFALCYGIFMFFSNIFGYLALSAGSMALSSLLVSYSVIIPGFYGIVFLKEPFGLLQILGFVLLLISMRLIIKQPDKVKINKKWLTYVAITFLSNGICSVIQKMHQEFYPGAFCKEFMLYSLFIIFILFTLIAPFTKEEKSSRHIKYAVPAGILMGLSNFLTLALASKMNASVLFPITTIFSSLFNVTASRIFFKDRLNILQLSGIALGITSVLLLK